jgi:hypothetical protein
MLIVTVPGALGFAAAPVSPAFAPVVMVTVAEGTFDVARLCTRVLFPLAIEAGGASGGGGGGGLLCLAFPVGASLTVIVDRRTDMMPEAITPPPPPCFADAGATGLAAGALARILSTAIEIVGSFGNGDAAMMFRTCSSANL